MESIHGPKKPGARAGLLAAFLLLALLLALPCAWYAVYHGQMTASAAGPASPGMAPSSRPSGVISLAPPRPGQIRTVQIQHTGGQVITTVNDGGMTLTMRGTDPPPPSNPVDALGQSLCDRYNAWKCEKGDPRQNAGVIWASGAVSITGIMNLQPGRPAGPTLFMFTGHAPAPATVHAQGTRAPGSSPPPAARIPAHP